MKIDIVDVADKRLAAVRHQGPYVEIGAAFGVLDKRAAELGLKRGDDTWLVAVFFDDPESTPAEELRAIAAISVAEDAAIDGLEEARLPSGRYLRAEFIGHYAGLAEAWGRLYGEEIPKGGYTLRDAENFEVYVSDHDSTPPDELRTDLYVPIA